MSSPRHSELDLAVANMDSQTAEEAVSGILRGIPGIHAVRIVSQGVWLDYDASTLTPFEICNTLQRAGFRAGIFQDSSTGATGSSSA